MFHAIALLIALVGEPAPAPEVCQLSVATPGKTPTSACMGCHDGSVAAMADVSFPAAPGFAGEPHDSGNGAHPIDLDYEASAQRRPGSFTPVSALPREVTLQDGKITCLTCHRPDSQERFRVSLSMDGSGLCLSCHRY